MLATAVIAVAAGLGVLTTNSASQAAVQSEPNREYGICLRVGTGNCYPIGPLGPYIPDYGTPEEAAFLQCVEQVAEDCAEIHGEPG